MWTLALLTVLPIRCALLSSPVMEEPAPPHTVKAAGSYLMRSFHIPDSAVGKQVFSDIQASRLDPDGRFMRLRSALLRPQRSGTSWAWMTSSTTCSWIVRLMKHG